MSLPTPHGDKLRSLLENDKLPANDRRRVEQAMKRYDAWVSALRNLNANSHDIVAMAVALLNGYRNFIDIDLIFDSQNDFLYRQKGQLKLDNTVLEEFLPHLVAKSFPELADAFDLSPQSCFSALYFGSTLRTAEGVPGTRTRNKDQDFSISKKLYIRTSFNASFNVDTETLETSLGYLCAECKTNLDKTMFQEASATTHDVKTGVPGAKYLLLCEWLDMTPISTTGTDIDEVLLLRKAKRLGSQVRSRFASRAGRASARAEYERFIQDHPFAPDVFQRLIVHVRALVEDGDPDETDVLTRGYF